MIQNIPLWQFLTHLGAAGLIAPLLCLAAVDLWRSNQQDALRTWLAFAGFAVALTLVSKIAFFGWGVGITALDFTGISGHALLAGMVYPVLIRWLINSPSPAAPWFTLAAGTGIVIAIGASRVVLGYHSFSEVLAAWCLAAVVSSVTLRRLQVRRRPVRALLLAPVLLLLAFHPVSSSYLPTHDWEIRIALFFSGRNTHFSRSHLHHDAAVPTE